jgi:rhodanese-related sulfurtransferase
LAVPTRPVQGITRDELASKNERGDRFRLVMALNEWAFNAKRIPGSERFDSEAELKEAVDPAEEVVVYCTNPKCHASIALYHALVDAGYENVRRYHGGIEDWEEHGMPLEGEWA